MDLRIAVLDALDALGRSEEAQALRWGKFERVERVEPLRAYLKRLWCQYGDIDPLQTPTRGVEPV